MRILVQDCLTHRLTEKESLEYIEKRTGEKVKRDTYYTWKNKLKSDKELDIFFNEHTRIGFVRDQRDRKDEIMSVLEGLMRRWKNMKGKEKVDEYRMVRLSEAIINANKRMEEISLSNPVISAIKAKVDAVGKYVPTSETSEQQPLTR